ncbi:phosphate ABC transporter substrate-binding protein [Erythrobacteraceae bacterium CFH 75059]|uniref:substrate-binding domain-containing protein n=1 Tax=Qipengyuania thermophila TaxID=2509361 RepID=UPI00101F899B|nr:substrate-binding domain-containing protein [Qipengyuania thermophila]TCD05103.1 phosphate ABC transporter substrate-binding protein [Erythrobacteraceae bacterium CFH 75059]
MTASSRVAMLLLPVLALAACNSGGGTRDTIRVVGSSTVLPFAKAVAQEFARSNPGFKSPIIESTGTGAGFALFCRGLGPDTPDITNASRRIKPSEFQTCQNNGVTDVVEVKVGYDGLVLASAVNGITMNLTPELVYRALAARPYGQPQTATTWADVDPSLPAQRILVYGPPSTSGTRDSFNELVMEAGCNANPAMEALADSNAEEHDRICTEIRTDGAFVEQGEQDNLILQKIESNPQTVGIFGFSYLEENLDRVKALPMNGVTANVENIASGDYLGARPMFIYIKRAHADAIPGLREFVAAWVANWGRDGLLAQRGLVALPAAEAAEQSARATQMRTLTAADLG